MIQDRPSEKPDDFRFLVFKRKRGGFTSRCIDAAGIVGFGESMNAANDNGRDMLVRQYHEKGEALRVEPSKADLMKYEAVQAGEPIIDDRCVAAIAAKARVVKTKEDE